VRSAPGTGRGECLLSSARVSRAVGCGEYRCKCTVVVYSTGDCRNKWLTDGLQGRAMRGKAFGTRV